MLFSLSDRVTQQTRIITRSPNGILIRARHNTLIDTEIQVLPGMRNTATPTVRPRPIQAYQARFAWWLAVAVVLHALLLLIPARQDLLPGPTLTTLTVALSRIWRAPPQANSTDSGRSELTPAERRPAQPGTPNAGSPRVASPPTAAPPVAAPRAESPSPSPGAGVQPGDTRAAVTTARLLDFAHRREWNLPEPSDPPRLGVPTPHPPPPNWRSDTPAEGAALPAKTGIVDQWLAADGSRNVMIRTPTGQVLCGRAEAWNPMSPLVEPVMMYRACGGGRRTFEMPARPGRVLLR